MKNIEKYSSIHLNTSKETPHCGEFPFCCFLSFTKFHQVAVGHINLE